MGSCATYAADEENRRFEMEYAKVLEKQKSLLIESLTENQYEILRNKVIDLEKSLDHFLDNLTVSRSQHRAADLIQKRVKDLKKILVPEV